jgi:hypothetical protein
MRKGCSDQYGLGGGAAEGGQGGRRGGSHRQDPRAFASPRDLTRGTQADRARRQPDHQSFGETLVGRAYDCSGDRQEAEEPRQNEDRTGSADSVDRGREGSGEHVTRPSRTIRDGVQPRLEYRAVVRALLNE